MYFQEYNSNQGKNNKNYRLIDENQVKKFWGKKAVGNKKIENEFHIFIQLLLEHSSFSVKSKGQKLTVFQEDHHKGKGTRSRNSV